MATATAQSKGQDKNCPCPKLIVGLHNGRILTDAEADSLVQLDCDVDRWISIYRNRLAAVARLNGLAREEREELPRLQKIKNDAMAAIEREGYSAARADAVKSAMYDLTEFNERWAREKAEAAKYLFDTALESDKFPKSANHEAARAEVTAYDRRNPRLSVDDANAVVRAAREKVASLANSSDQNRKTLAAAELRAALEKLSRAMQADRNRDAAIAEIQNRHAGGNQSLVLVPERF